MPVEFPGVLLIELGADDPLAVAVTVPLPSAGTYWLYQSIALGASTW